MGAIRPGIVEKVPKARRCRISSSFPEFRAGDSEFSGERVRSIMGNPVEKWWHELNCWDARAAISFYSRTLGWQFDDIPLNDGSSYWVARKNGAPVCGLFQLDKNIHRGIPAHWMTYMTVTDMDVAIRATAFAGGKVSRAPLHVPGLGKLAIVTDVADALIGLIEPEVPHPLALRPLSADAPRGHHLAS